MNNLNKLNLNNLNFVKHDSKMYSYVPNTRIVRFDYKPAPHQKIFHQYANNNPTATIGLFGG